MSDTTPPGGNQSPGRKAYLQGRPQHTEPRQSPTSTEGRAAGRSRTRRETGQSLRVPRERPPRSQRSHTKDLQVQARHHNRASSVLGGSTGEGRRPSTRGAVHHTYHNDSITPRPRKVPKKGPRWLRHLPDHKSHGRPPSPPSRPSRTGPQRSHIDLYTYLEKRQTGGYPIQPTPYPSQQGNPVPGRTSQGNQPT